MNHTQLQKTQPRKPAWLKRSLPKGSEYERVRAVLGRGKLHSVCQEAKCPNIWECFSQETATFLILGDRCTRNCGFCAIAHGPSGPPDPEEPARVAEAATSMGLIYMVITSVTRDDLPDGGAGLFAETIKEIRKRMPDALVEVLIPDFQGNTGVLQAVLNAGPNVLNHNLETVPRLYSRARPEAVYSRSLDLLKNAHAYAPDIPTKSGLMLGLGESPEEVEITLKDLLDVGCGILTLGQYLQPSKEHLPVERFIPPEEFDKWREKALGMGFSQVASGPFVRSSYHAKELYQAVRP
ncbi:MAG: lipoyl synthase [Deltaproteobacteria bacterium]|nr:lipoyl synthase [Deltaproteobacteria bacterium]